MPEHSKSSAIQALEDCIFSVSRLSDNHGIEANFEAGHGALVNHNRH